jgi:hypothetical protein
MTVTELYVKRIIDIPEVISTSFQLDDASSFRIYWNPDKPSEYINQEVYLGVHMNRYGDEEIKRSYFSTDTSLEELDTIFSNEISKAILQEI